MGQGDTSTSGSMGGGTGGSGGMHTDPVSPGGVGSGISTNTQPSGSGASGMAQPGAAAGGSAPAAMAH